MKNLIPRKPIRRVKVAYGLDDHAFGTEKFQVRGLAATKMLRLRNQPLNAALRGHFPERGPVRIPYSRAVASDGRG